MKLRDLLLETWSALTANKGRSMLTILGIVIGIAAVITMTALIGGIKQSLVSELGLNQSRAVMIYANAGRTVTVDELDKISQGIGKYEYLSGAQGSSAQLTSGKKQTSTTVFGVGKGFVTANGGKIVSGRDFTDEEYASGAMVALIEKNTASKIFGADTNPVGKAMSIGNDQYTVVGVVEMSGLLGGSSGAWVPFNTSATRLTGNNGVGSIVGYAKDGEDMGTVQQETKKYLQSYFNLPPDRAQEEIYVETMESVQNQLDSMLMAFQIMMTMVASISLLVGGIGIMNMMLTNVTERIREIGLRKALGARSADITKQFLMESVALCLSGGIIGTVFGYLGAWGLAQGAGLFLPGMTVTPAFSVATVVIVVAICTIIGIVFGYGPARRAAKLDPVESLHYQ